MELIYVFRTLYRKKWYIVVLSLLAVAAAFALTVNQRKTFRSTAQLATGFTVSEDIKLSEESFNLPQIDVKFNNTIENITSPKVLSLLSYSLLLHDLSEATAFRKPDAKEQERFPQLSGLMKEEAVRVLQHKRDSILLLSAGQSREKLVLDMLEMYGYHVEAIRKHLLVARYQRTDYIDIAYRSENPELSAFVVNTLCKEFQRYFDAFRRERSLESMASLDSLVRRRKQELDVALANRTRYLTDSVSSNLDPNMVGANTLSQINQYEAALADEQGRIQDLSYQISQLGKQAQVTGSTVALPRTAGGTADNGEYFVLRKQYNDLYDVYLKSAGRDAELRRRLDDLQRKMKSRAPSDPVQSETGVPNSAVTVTQRKIDVEGQLRAATAKAAFYRKKLSELKAGLGNISAGSTATQERLDKEVELATIEYTAVKEKVNMAANLSEGVANNFKQTLFGQPALEPEPSKRLIILLLSGMVAFLLSSLVFIFIEYFDNSIKTPAQFNRLTGLKLLGTVNHVDLKKADIGARLSEGGGRDGGRNNIFREFLRKVRYEVESSGHRVILFTSTEPRQGKTTLVQALAFSLSLSKKKVLILDTNFCNNDLTKAHNAAPRLEEFSGENGHLLPVLESLVTHSKVAFVDIIGCRGGDYTPSEILPQKNLLHFLPELLQLYDYVFMEGAPLNGFTDTKELAVFADGVIGVFAATTEIKQVDKESIRFFKTIPNKFMGAILNKVSDADLTV